MTASPPADPGTAALGGATRRTYHAGVTYLDEFLDAARVRVTDAESTEPLSALRERALDRPVAPSFREALSGPGVAVIAEVKRASPSKGDLAADLDATAQGRAYRDGGAAAISVLTEPTRFKGDLSDLVAVAATGTPALRKDFIVDPYQVWEARAAGASAILLIVAALGPHDLHRLLQATREAQLDALVEVHDEREAETALEVDATVVGVNARDLRTFDVDRSTFERVRPLLGADVVAVAESGIRGPDDVRAAALVGADAVLVGESLVTATDPRSAVALLVSAGAAPLTSTEYR